jgi:uncharacterized protein (DUF1800 family)
MKLPRRQVLGLGAAGLGAALLSGCESLEQRLTKPTLPTDAFATPNHTDEPARRLLNRVAYGPRPGDVARVARMGTAAYIEEQLHPERIDEDATLSARLRPLGDTLDSDSGTLFDTDDHQLINTLRQATLLRAVYSRHQLYERVVEFWTDHFNIYAFKGEGAQFKVTDDRDTIRANALGRFRDLLGASARSAAMLGYLDNGGNRKGVPNENYARELMELHTLGVHGGYTQHDVQEVARCLTGWTSQRHWHRGRFLFDASVHDNGPKNVLGTDIPAGEGQSDGERVLDIVAAHPATAHHLGRKLCRHFLGTEPESLVASLAATFQKTGGDIPSVLRGLLQSPELMTSPPILKRPLDYMASALRVFNADTDAGASLQGHLEAMGQPLFAWPMPDGFPDHASAWIGALLPRWNFALSLCSGQIGNTAVDWHGLTQAAVQHGLTAPDALRELALGGTTVSPTLRGVQDKYTNAAEFGAMLLMSPEFQWR